MASRLANPDNRRVRLTFADSNIHGTRGELATDKSRDGRIAVRWDDPKPGHPVTWPLVDHLTHFRAEPAN